MQVRKLEPQEWNLLGESPWPADRAIAIAALDAGKLVGRVFLVAPAHVEGIEIESPYRSTLTMGRLIRCAEGEAQNMGIKTLFAYGANERMNDYISRLGYEKQQLTVWRKELA